MTIAHIVFILLNSGLYIGIALWYLKTHLLPSIRASWREQQETIQQLSDEVKERTGALTQADTRYAHEEREVARLTVAVEQWVGILNQRAGAQADELRTITQRYKERCEETARIRVTREAQQLVVKQTLKNARILLKQKYADDAREAAHTHAVIERALHKEQR